MDINHLLDSFRRMEGANRSSATVPALRAGDRLSGTVLEADRGRDALVAFGPFKAYVRLPLPVVTGQEVHVRVEPDGGGLRLALLPAGGSSVAPDARGALPIQLFEPIPDRPPSADLSRLLVPGESIEGRITGFEKEGLHLVDFGRFKAFVKIDVPTRPGQMLPLTVVAADTGITLRLTPGTPRDASAALPGTAAEAITQRPPPAAELGRLGAQVRQLLEALQPTHAVDEAPPTPAAYRALANLGRLLQPAAPAGDPAELAARIRDFVEGSGIHFEKRLEAAVHDLMARGAAGKPAEMAATPAVRDLMAADLKPNLLIINQFLVNAGLDRPALDPHLLETMQRAVQRTLAYIDQQQAMVVEKPVDPNLLHAFAHPLILGDTPSDARLKVYCRRKGRDGRSRPPRVALLLEMDRLGALRADLWLAGRDLSVTFFVATTEARAHLDGAREEIRSALKETFDTVALSVVLNEKKSARFDEEDLAAPPSRQVDLSA